MECYRPPFPNEIFSMLDLIKSLVAGKVVRDQSFLQEDPELMWVGIKKKFLFRMVNSTFRNEN